MKKFLCAVSILLTLALLSACSSQKDNKLSQSEVSQNNTDSSVSTTVSTPDNNFNDVAEPFRSILEDKQTFYSSRKKDIKISSYNRDIWQYAAVDFDSDGVDEFAIMLQDGDIVILRKNGNSVIGFDFGVHAMYQINKDGTYLWNENSGNIYGCSKLEFSQNDCKSVELFRVEHGENDSISYYVNGKPVSESEFKATQAKISTESITWTSLK